MSEHKGCKEDCEGNCGCKNCTCGKKGCETAGPKIETMNITGLPGVSAVVKVEEVADDEIILHLTDIQKLRILFGCVTAEEQQAHLPPSLREALGDGSNEVETVFPSGRTEPWKVVWEDGERVMIFAGMVFPVRPVNEGRRAFIQLADKSIKVRNEFFPA